MYAIRSYYGSVYGADPILRGTIIFDGEEIRPVTPADAIKKGMALCPEDRKYEGIIGNGSIKKNISVSILKELCKFGFIDRKKEIKIGQVGITEFNVKTTTMDKEIKDLSGGNQQKVLLARSVRNNFV